MITADEMVTLEHASPTTFRKGWASLASFAKMYKMPDGRWLRIRAYEDFDALEKMWADARGEQVVEEVHETRTNDGGGEPDPVRSAAEAEAIRFIRDYTGTFGFILDLRARRGWGTKWYSLSDAQVAAVLRVKAREEAPRPEPKPVVESAPMTDGMFRKDGVIFKVQKAIHGSGNLYAKMLVVDGPGEGHFEYAPGAIRTLTLADKMSREEAAEFGRLYGICVVCGTALTDERSIEAGIGPVCAKRV